MKMIAQNAEKVQMAEEISSFQEGDSVTAQGVQGEGTGNSPKGPASRRVQEQWLPPVLMNPLEQKARQQLSLFPRRQSCESHFIRGC